MNTSSTSRLRTLWLPLLLVSIGLLFIVIIEAPSPQQLRLVLPVLPIDREIADEFALLLDQQADVTIRQVQLRDSENGELQALLGCARATIDQRLSRARARLRTRLEQQRREEDAR